MNSTFANIGMGVFSLLSLSVAITMIGAYFRKRQRQRSYENIQSYDLTIAQRQATEQILSPSPAVHSARFRANVSEVPAFEFPASSPTVTLNLPETITAMKPLQRSTERSNLSTWYRSYGTATAVTGDLDAPANLTTTTIDEAIEAEEEPAKYVSLNVKKEKKKRNWFGRKKVSTDKAAEDAKNAGIVNDNYNPTTEAEKQPEAAGGEVATAIIEPQ